MSPQKLSETFKNYQKGGLLIVNYGYWKGSKKAVDEYFFDKKNVFFHRIDETGIIILKN